MPLIIVSMGQAVALLVGGFDVSVAALMTLCVVIASFTLTPTTSGFALVTGSLALIGVGIATGLFNAFLIRVLRLPSIVATLGTLSILEGAALWLRSYPQGAINTDLTNGLTKSVGWMPLAFIGVVILAALADLWLYRSRPGLALRSVGLDETSSRRLGMSTGRTIILAFVVCSVLASIAGFYLAAEVQVGSPIIGNQALESIAAAVLGGASLAGGRGSFFGTLLAAFFLTEINNVLPFFQQPTEYAEMAIGVLILLALLLYQSPELVARFRSARHRVDPARRPRRPRTRLGGLARLAARVGRTADHDPDRVRRARGRSSRAGAARRSRRRSTNRGRARTRRTRRGRPASARDIAVLAAAVGDERVVRARLRANRIHDAGETRRRGRCAASGAPSALRRRG